MNHSRAIGPCSHHVRRMASVAALTLAVSWLLLSPSGALAESHWYKGCTHAHSFWSDGDQFPDMVIDWYKSHGYDFFALSDHNVLMEGQRWVLLKGKRRSISDAVVKKYLARFGDDWVDLRGQGDLREVRLKTFDEIKRRLDEPDRFLMIQAEEITGRCGDKQVHVNAINLVKPIQPQKGKTVTDTIRADLAAVQRQAQKTGRTILAHVNHPNWKGYYISAEDLAHASEARLFELCNNGNGINNLGDAKHPSTERLWDIANTIRLAGLKTAPIYGVGADDAHRHHQMDPRVSNPGRAWIVVRAERLAVDPILNAIQRGDFYVSTGIVLKRLDYDPATRTLRVAVDPKPGTKYVIEFLGSTRDADPTGRDGAKISQVLARRAGATAAYRFRGNELFVRAVVRSDRKMENPPANSIDHETAWTQPVGWEQRLDAK